MSFAEYHTVIQEGDWVLMYMGPGKITPIEVKKGQVFQARFGGFPHESFIGQKFGSKVYAKGKKGESSKKLGFVYALYPTPELWTSCLPHRTQILYIADISLVSFYLDIKPGSIVVESGTGSASLSHSLIRTIAPTGHLYTFEFHEQRAQKAREEFAEHKISHLVTVTHRDVL
eukprot:Colp12_sorted_trinity150504_noHs@12106